jgi:hypothetical protein
MSDNTDNESFTYSHSDIKKTLDRVIETVQTVRDAGAALFDRTLDWFSKEDQVKTIDTITSNTKILSKVDGLCNYISLQIDGDSLWAFPSNMNRFEEKTTDQIIEIYKDCTNQLRKDVLTLEGVTSVLHPSIVNEKELYNFVVSDIKSNTNVIYVSLNDIERANDLNNIRTAIARGDNVPPRSVGAFMPRK